MKSLLAFLLLASGSPAWAAQLRYAGILSDSSGRPLEGSYLLRFSVRSGSDPAEAWSERRYVRADGGRFAVTLGDKNPVPDAALRGAYRLIVETPPGTGWNVAPDAAAPAAVTAAPEAARLERELESARKEREESKRRLEALEKAVGSGAAPAASTRLYTVQSGETLRSVAKKTLGDERHWVLIYQANSDRVQRAGELTPGQRLVIPAGTR